RRLTVIARACIVLKNRRVFISTAHSPHIGVGELQPGTSAGIHEQLSVYARRCELVQLVPKATYQIK
ncbi:unnamed protein product, partial [Ectocarpus sp. 12 AP-2014]